MVKRPGKTKSESASHVASRNNRKARLRQFSKGDSNHPGFAFTRFWWEGDGARSGIAKWVHKKLAPGDDARFGVAARHEVLLPPQAPSDYTDLDHLLDRFDQALPQFHRHVMVQTKISLDPAATWHCGYEVVRAFAKSHFAIRFPVILVAHIPSVAALEANGSHVHCIVLARSLGPDGLGAVDHRLCSDHGYESSLAAWQAFRGDMK